MRQQKGLGSGFLGFPRATGRPGVRNYLLILNLTGLTQPAARRIAAGLHGSCFVSMPHGLAISGAGEGPVDRTMVQLARHPNAGAVLLLSADRAKSAQMIEALAGLGKPLDSLVLDSTGRDILRFCEEATRVGARRLVELSTQRRVACPSSELMVALECGLSDPTSGIAANPLVGDLVDRLVADGGSAVFGETTEWIGCEGQLAERAATAEIGERILAAIAAREAAATRAGIDLVGNNPNRANIDAGLSTIEDKALGSVAKSGTAPITGIIEYGDAAVGSGLFAMDGPSYTPESLTGLIAAGAQLALFTTGLGNSYVSSLAPTIKITANQNTARTLTSQIDFDCSEIIEGGIDRSECCSRLADHVLEIASGALTFGEVLGEGDEVISRFGATL